MMLSLEFQGFLRYSMFFSRVFDMFMVFSLGFSKAFLFSCVFCSFVWLPLGG